MESAKELQGRILLVDDESAILRTFRYCLEDEGYNVATANSAAQADALMQCAQISRLSCARSSIGPGGWPVTSAWPKLRTEAPSGVALRSNTLTLRPRLAAA